MSAYLIFSRSTLTPNKDCFHLWRHTYFTLNRKGFISNTTQVILSLSTWSSLHVV